MNRLIEVAHYYECKGPTIWSQIGVELLEKFKKTNDKTLSFVDDVHSLSDMSDNEKNEAVIEFNFSADYKILESKMMEPALEILNILLNLSSKKNRAKLNPKDNKYYISGFPITNEFGKPSCVLLDAALTLHKNQLGFDKIVNILPNFYEQEQRNLIRILAKLNMPHLLFSVILFNKNGEYFQLDNQSTLVPSEHLILH